MKKCSKYLSLILALVCLLMSFAGCRFDLLVGDLSLPGSADPTTAPTIEDGNGPLPTDNARGRGMMPDTGSVNNGIGNGNGITRSITG